jgi:Negative regulator of beta-lactamase expression
MIIDRPSPNFDDRDGQAVDVLVIHYTGMETAAAALDRLVDPAAQVSAHYMIDTDGRCYRLVDEAHRAWHAGQSFWRGATDINRRSVGIELVNPGHAFGYRPFGEAQMAVLVDLAVDIVRRHRIPARNVVGHSDVAPRRKMDPGELFDWQRLAAAGVGLWPGEADACVMEPEAIDAMLGAVGYETVDRGSTLRAFQRHFRPARVNGRIDFETARRLKALADLCREDSPPPNG